VKERECIMLKNAHGLDVFVRVPRSQRYRSRLPATPGQPEVVVAIVPYRRLTNRPTEGTPSAFTRKSR
jgi:hypothetical protein